MEITQSGFAMGTWEYASPEQLQDAKHVDFRTDIYSLGSTLHFMLTGNSARDMREQRLAPFVRECIYRATERQPADRFANMAEFRDALNEVMKAILLRNVAG
jgi:serine/threonine protein kinase